MKNLEETRQISSTKESSVTSEIDYENQNNSEEETVGFHMTRVLVTMQSYEPVVNAYKTMIENHIGCIPVLEGGHAVGVLTARVLIKCAARKTSLTTEVRALCTPSPTASPFESVRTAIERLRTNHARHLLVVNDDQTLIGLVSQTDLLEASRRLIVQSERKLARIEQIAYRDELTGLFTRSVFENAFEDEFKRAQRYGGLLALLLIDIDLFKNINDNFGHPAGDSVLKRIGEIVRKSIRKVDIACRYGGDELAILMPECGTRSAAILGERIRSEVELGKFEYGDRLFCTTISGGVCKWVPSFKSQEEMLSEADKYLYEAKRKGRNRIEVSY